MRGTNSSKKETTRSITFRFPTKLVEGLDSEAEQKNVSLNVLIRQILEKYMSWDRFGDKIGMIPVPKKILMKLGEDMTGKDVDKIIKVLIPTIQDSVMFMKGDFDLPRCIETLEDYMKASGMKSDHRIEGGKHNFIIQHGLGIKWSLFTEQLLKEIFYKFVPDLNLVCKTTDTTVSATIALGPDFDEHNY